MSAKRRLRPEDYTVGWLCALARTEQVAAIKMLDEQHQELPKPVRDYNTYTYGSIGSHNIVIACLPISHPGTTSASRMADLLPTSFPNMRLHLFVGIGGGIPHNPPHLDASQDIHLGDVVVGVDQTPGVAGVVQYDFMRDKGEEGRDLLGIFDKPNPELLTALGKLFSNYEMGDSNPHLQLAKLTGLRSDFARPPPGGDKFYRSTYKHINGAPNCDQCSIDQTVVRNERQPLKQESLEQETSIPVFHQGQILSGNSVIKDAKRRDELSQAYPHARCLEMEAAGVVDQTHCLVIRGISDYADSHKNKTWQPYAAGTAAAFARELLLTVQPSVVKELGNISPTAGQAADPQSSENLDPGNVHWMVPKRANKLFTGRTRILEKLGHSLASQSPSSLVSEEQKIFVVVGYGGIGKSEVCLKFANDHRQHFWGVFWIDASSEETAKRSFIDIGKLCGGKAETFEQVKTWLANICYSWILIIDNADNPDIDYAKFFPSGEKGNILLTTRNQQCCAHATVGFEDLDHLDLQDATSLLFKAAGIAESSRGDNHKAAEKVVQDLSFHTLAIVQAGAFIKLRFCSLEEYPIRFKKEKEQLLKYYPKQAQSTYGSVFATFEISATHLESSQDQNAANALSLLQLLGFFHFQEIPERMFSRAREEAIAIREAIGRGMPQDEIYRLSELQISRLPEFIMPRNHIATDSIPWQWCETLNLLESHSIIKYSGTEEDLSFSMHPLAHTWARSRPGLTPREQSWAAAGSVIALSMHGVNYNVFHEKLRSHVGAYLDYPILEYRAEMTELEICQTHYTICWLVLQLRDTSRLRDLLKILETFEAWTGANGKSSVYIKILTANCFLEEGQHQTAVGLLERLVETNHADDLDLQATLANAYIECKQHQKAVPLLERLAKIRERTGTPDAKYLLWVRHLLGCTYIANKQFERAAPLLEQVVEIQKGSLVPTFPDRLASEFWLGRAYIGKRQYEKAAKILQQVLDIRCQILDVKDPHLLATQHWLAKAYIGMGKDHYGRAAKLLEQVVRIEENILAPENPDRLASQHELAEAYIGMGNGHYGRAAELLEQVVRIDEETLASDDSDRLESQCKLAEAYIGMGIGHYERPAEILEQVVRAPDDSNRMISQQLLEEVRGRIEAENDAESTSVSGETT